ALGRSAMPQLREHVVGHGPGLEGPAIRPALGDRAEQEVGLAPRIDRPAETNAREEIGIGRVGQRLDLALATEVLDRDAQVEQRAAAADDELAAERVAD